MSGRLKHISTRAARAVRLAVGALKSELFDRSRLIRRGEGRDLYRTRFGDLYWLTPQSYVDRCIIYTGVFEPPSTEAVKRLVRPGQVILDVGANIGYYTVLLSKLVGAQGQVLAFEPTEHFRGPLQQNVAVNRLGNVEIFPVGLSDRRQSLKISISDSTATLHCQQPSAKNEEIELVTLDEFVEQHPLSRLDFVKIDVDGHEPHFLRGASATLDKFDPVILLEISHPHYLDAGITAWDFYDFLKEKGYRIYHEEGLREITTKEDFLVKCGNFAYSANVIISKKELRLNS